jgi:hypothetical protein
MPDNVFRIPIVAVDQATAVVRRVNASFGKFTKPIAEIKKSVASLGKEAGFDRFAKSAVGAASAAGSVASQVKSIAAPLAAIAGIGAVAGIVEMTQAWVSQGAEIARTSRIIGVYQGDVQSMRAVARGFGVDAGTTSASLNEMGNTIEGALFGRNQDALAMLGRLGIGVRRLRDGSIDTIAMMKAVADSTGFQKGNAQVKQLIASTLGLSGLLPVMLQGSAGIERYQKDMERLGAVQTPQAIAAAESFAISQTRLGIAFDGVRNRIVSGLIPVFQPIIDHTTEWISANRELIGTKVDYYARRIADGIQHIDWDRVDRAGHAVVDTIRSIVGWMGGWENAAIAVAIALNGNLIASVFNLSGALIRLGISAAPVAASGIALVAAGAASLAFKGAVALESLSGLAGGIPILGVALRGLSGVFLALGAAIEATPIGWIITGVAALAFAGYELYKHWSEIADWWHRLWGGMSDDADKGKAAIAAPDPQPTFPPAPAAAANGNTAGAAQAVAYMQAKGWSHEQAAGLIAGFTRESQLNPAAVGDNGQAIGIGQWHKDRAAALSAHFGKSIAAMNLNEQLDAADYELRQGGEQRAGRAIAGTQSAAAAGAAASLLYERPADAGGEANARSALAVNLFKGTQDMPGPYSTLTAAANQNAPGDAGNAGPTVIEVRFSGAPVGMTAEAKGPNAERVTLRVEHSMPMAAVS